jgi:hypothetical protein
LRRATARVDAAAKHPHVGDDDQPDLRMTLRNRGDPAGFSKLAAPIVARAVSRANRKDLAQLKAILEGTN